MRQDFQQRLKTEMLRVRQGEAWIWAVSRRLGLCHTQVASTRDREASFALPMWTMGHLGSWAHTSAGPPSLGWTGPLITCCHWPSGPGVTYPPKCNLCPCNPGTLSCPRRGAGGALGGMVGGLGALEEPSHSLTWRPRRLGLICELFWSDSLSKVCAQKQTLSCRQSALGLGFVLNPPS